MTLPFAPANPVRARRARKVDQSVYDLARARIRAIFDRFDRVCVAFSGGKDSTVCLQLALEVARERGELPLHAYFIDEEAIPLQTSEYVRRVTERGDVEVAWYCLPVKHRNACSRQHPYWSPWAPEDENLWVRPLPPEGITRLEWADVVSPDRRVGTPDLQGLLFPPERFGTVGVIMGIRAQESLTRRRAVLQKGGDEHYLVFHDVPTNPGNVWKAYPIYDWTVEDVWTAPKRFGWDYNRAYDVMDQAGMPANRQRCSPPFGEEPLGALWHYQICFPEVWARMSTRVPGASTAIRYARSELYAFGDLPEKPADLSWPDFLLHYVGKFDPAVQPKVAARLKRFVTEHARKTSDPILESVPHPLTGLSWKFLQQIAMRGDFKERRNPLYGLSKDEYAKTRARYEAARTVEQGDV